MEILKSIWGNAFDQSICGIVVVKNDVGRVRAFLGSKDRYSTETVDENHIAKCGNELTVGTLEGIIELLKGDSDGR